MSRIDDLISGISAGDVRSLSRAITIIESRLPADKEVALQIIEGCSTKVGTTHRVGVTGVPGVGKSTFIESIGMRIVEDGKKVAVLAIDPTSSRSSGSILGDKTRMEDLSSHQNAFIRPSASAQTLGGVARKTRETILLCEAAGYDTILIETVGVGQSETTVRGMVDTFLLLMLAGAGDELQGIKRGIMEMADILLVNKVEEENLKRARSAESDYRTAIHMLGKDDFGWSTQTGLVSALTGFGIPESLEMMKEHLQFLKDSGAYGKQRMDQDLLWFDESIRQSVLDIYLNNKENKGRIAAQRSAVANGEVSPLIAVKKALN